MSTTDTSATCAECNQPRDPSASVAGSYCSRECYHRHKGRKAHNLIRFDHRFCATCLNKLKEITRPPEEWEHREGVAYQVALESGATLRKENGTQVLDLTEVADRRPVAVDSVIGFEHSTPDAEPVEKSHALDEHRELITTGLGCSCGQTDHRTQDETLQEVDLPRTLTNYIHRFRELHDEGQLEQRIDKSIFFNTFRETQDLLLSLGKALHQ